MAKKAGMATGVEVARISVKVSPNSKEFRGELQKKLNAIEDSITAKIQVEPNMGNFRKEVQAKTKGMHAKVNVDPDLDATSAKGFFAKIGQLFNKMEAPSFGTGVNPSAMLIIAAAVAAITPLIAGLMGAIAAALTAIPGLLAAVLIPIGALALGMDGLKKAAETLKQPFDDLKKSMSERVQEQFTPVFEKLKDIFPTLKSALPSVTAGLANMAQSIANVVTSPENLAKLETTIRNVAAGLDAAAPGIGSFTQGFLDLINAFSTKLPDIGKWFSDTGASFSKWVTDFTTKGPDGVSKFDVAMQNLGDTLKLIGGGLVELVGKALDFFSDPQKVQSFKTELDGLLNTILAIADAINWMAEQYSKIPAIGDGKADSILDFNIPMKAAFDGLKSIDWSGIWQGIKDSASTAWQFVQQVWAPVGSFFSTLFTEVGAIVGPIWNVISTVATTAWNVIAAVWGGAMDFLSGIFSGLAGPATTVWNMISGAAQAAWGVIQAVWAPIGAWFSGIWNQVTSVIQTVWNTIKTVISTAANEVITTIQTWGQNIINMIQSIDLAAAGRALIEKLINGIKSMAGAVKDAVSSVIGGFMNLIPHSPAKEGPFSGSGWTSIFTGGQALGEQFGNGLQDGLQSTLEMAKEMADKISKAMNDGTDASGALNGIDSDDLKKSMAVIEQEKKRLKIQKDQLPDSDKEGKKALQNQIDQLQAQKDILAYQKDRVKNEAAYGDEAGDDPLVKAASKLMSEPVNFAKATGKQFLSDIGISGEGALSKAVTEGIQYIFQIGSVDEAMSIKDREDKKQAMTVVGSR
ncbi:tape measure protein [Mycobacterium phage Chargerpower]|nr:tape measure protein [Mycobacterium phage Chargerpower]